MFIRFAGVTVLLLGTLILLSPSGFSQPGQWSKGGGGKGFGGDPKERFEKMANGKSYILVSEVSPSFIQESLAKFAAEQGIKDGKITLEKYLLYSEQRAAARAANPDGKGFPGGFMKKSDGPSKTEPSKTAEKPAEKPVDRSTAELTRMAEEDFKKQDRNGDGFLNEDEMHPTLQRELVHWDKNGDGLIDKEEYVPYFIEHYTKNQKAREDRERAQAEQSSGGSGRIVIEDDLDSRPVVLRYGKLPKELPDWFDKLDTNQDGLVSLGEWRKADKSFEEFKAFDRNEDGLLTPEEVLRYLAEHNGTQIAGTNGTGSNSSAGTTGSPSAAPGQPTSPFAAMMMNGFNRRPGGSGGPPRDDSSGGSRWSKKGGSDKGGR